MSKPSIPKGTRDFGPIEVAKRTYIFDTVKQVFGLFGFVPIETPVMENLQTLTGKYGDEGDKLIFKILNSGDYLKDAEDALLSEKNSNKLTPQISEKALRYDLTVPFARFVVMHRNDIKLPFKRYQVQPVWRADRPQKGRYREFYQCDVDIVGSESMLCEAELIAIYQEVFKRLGLKVEILINNRKLLDGLAEIIQAKDKFMSITIALDKLDKIGWDGVEKEMMEHGISAKQVQELKSIIESIPKKGVDLSSLEAKLSGSAIAMVGLNELKEALAYHQAMGYAQDNLAIDITLARGLNYYTSTIFEVKAVEVAMGSIGGGGRYNDLTGVFGWQGLAGVGVSFGADRIYDVLEQANLFPEMLLEQTKVLISNIDTKALGMTLPLLKSLRDAGIKAELYHELQEGALGKQLKFANDKQIPFMVVVGSDEVQKKVFVLKDLNNRSQQELTSSELIQHIQHG
jgi:histidyl-tRNA synthetase